MGPFTLFLIVTTGLYLMCGLAFLPIRKITYAMKLLVKKGGRKEKGKGDISPYGALMTAISAGSVGGFSLSPTVDCLNSIWRSV